MHITDSQYNLLTTAKEENVCIGRDSEIEHIVRILLREMRNNVLLVGEPGVGKKTIVKGLAQKSSSVLQKFIETIISLDAYELQAAYLSQKASFITDITQQLLACKNTVLFIPDIHALFQDTVTDFRSYYPIFSLFTRRADLKLICTIDPATYRQFMEKDVFLQRLFEIIRIEEPDEAETVQILIRLAFSMRISITDDTLAALVTIAKRYIFSNAMPLKCIDIFDESVAKAKIEGRSAPSLEDIKEVVSVKTGIPIASINATDQEKLLGLEQHLCKKVVGQDYAVKAVSEVIRRSRTGLKDPHKPIGSFLFIGGSGVGKTELAKNIAEFMYDSAQSLIRLDLSEYTESHSVQKLIGAPPGYIGYEEGGQLTNPIWERPYSLLLLDEIEKAHTKVFDIFLQVLDEGRLTDGQGKTVNFNNVIIIATSNAGYSKIIDDVMENTDLASPKFLEQKLTPVLMKYFRVEFLNRFDEIIVFRPLQFEDLIKVTKLQIAGLQKRLEEKNIKLEVSDELIASIAKKGNNPLFGARTIKRLIQTKIENTLAKMILTGELKEGSSIRW